MNARNTFFYLFFSTVINCTEAGVANLRLCPGRGRGSTIFVLQQRAETEASFFAHTRVFTGALWRRKHGDPQGDTRARTSGAEPYVKR